MVVNNILSCYSGDQTGTMIKLLTITSIVHVWLCLHL